jgi:N6-adenosine-specific RNA methylase IME4
MLQMELPKKKYNTIVIDPPWEVKAGCEWGSGGKSRDLVYPTMTLDQIKTMSIKDIAAEGCHLYIWTINKYIKETYEIAKAWGFKPSTLLVWAKKPNGIGLGGTYSLTTEFILFARRGTLNAMKRVDTTWWLWQRKKHSEKPNEFYNLIKKVSPEPRIDIFSRRCIAGFDSWGDEAPNEKQEELKSN